jgi:hypothetical protein
MLHCWLADQEEFRIKWWQVFRTYLNNKTTSYKYATKLESVLEYIYIYINGGWVGCISMENRIENWFGKCVQSILCCCVLFQ